MPEVIHENLAKIEKLENQYFKDQEKYLQKNYEAKEYLSMIGDLEM